MHEYALFLSIDLQTVQLDRHLKIELHDVLIPIALYAKNDRDILSEKELEYHLAMVVFELKEQGFSLE